MWNKEELPEEWKESIIVPTIRRVLKQTVVIKRHITFAKYVQIFPNILLSRLTPYAEKIIRDHQYGFRRSRSTAELIFCIRRLLEIKWEHNEAVHQVFIDFKEAYFMR
jgi:hypothetical protein